MKDFVYVNGWFDKYRPKSDCRFHTFKAALNMYRQWGGTTIVETGCARLPDDWGGGQSTLLFCDYVSHATTPGPHYLWSVDLSPDSVAAARSITAAYEQFRTLVCMDSVKFLKEWVGRKIDLLYLDSYDYPYGELLNYYGGHHDINAAFQKLASMTEDEVVEKHLSMIDPCQKHCLAELEAGLPHLSQRAVILIDDNSLAGGGKPRLAKQRLAELGWTCVYDFQQTLWIKV